MKNLLKRVIVGVIGIPIGLLLIWFGSYYFFTAILIISIISLFEFYKLTEKKGFNPLIWESIIFAALVELLIFYGIYSANFEYFLNSVKYMYLLIFISFVILFSINLFKRKENFIVNISVTLAGLIYILIPFISIMFIRFSFWDKTNYPVYFIITYFVSIWICDTAAYFIGSKWGRTKIAPKISPKKSWEGGIAGFAAGCLSFLFIGLAFNLPVHPLILTIFGVIVGTLGQIGDFVESAFKRDAGVKDSSKLLSEHGGMLDRFDSIMFTAPAILFILILIN